MCVYAQSGWARGCARALPRPSCFPARRLTDAPPPPLPLLLPRSPRSLSTIDRDYGIFNKIHHDIGTHVVHHLFPQIPHYNLCEATEAVKPVMGDYYR